MDGWIGRKCVRVLESVGGYTAPRPIRLSREAGRSGALDQRKRLARRRYTMKFAKVGIAGRR